MNLAKGTGPMVQVYDILPLSKLFYDKIFKTLDSA